MSQESGGGSRKGDKDNNESQTKAKPICRKVLKTAYEKVSESSLREF